MERNEFIQKLKLGRFLKAFSFPCAGSTCNYCLSCHCQLLGLLNTVLTPLFLLKEDTLCTKCCIKIALQFFGQAATPENRHENLQLGVLAATDCQQIDSKCLRASMGLAKKACAMHCSWLTLCFTRSPASLAVISWVVRYFRSQLRMRIFS